MAKHDRVSHKPSQQDRSSKQRSSTQRSSKRLTSPSDPRYPHAQAPKRMTLALDQRRPSHRSPAHRSYSPSLSSVHKRKVLPPPPGPPPLPHDTLDIPSPESPANGPFTPVSGQAHRQPFTGAAPDHSPGPPSPPSPSNAFHGASGPEYGSAYPSSPSHHASTSQIGSAPHFILHPTSDATPTPTPAAFTAANPGPSVAYVPGSFVAGVPFDSLPMHHQNFILKAATHCWKDQYAEVQRENKLLRASLASHRELRESIEDRVQLLEQRLSMERVGPSV